MMKKEKASCHRKKIESPMYIESFMRLNLGSRDLYIHKSPKGTLFTGSRRATGLFSRDVMATGNYMRTYDYRTGMAFYRTTGVTDLYYTWCKENHVFKDSRLYIAFGGKITQDGTSDPVFGRLYPSGFDAVLVGNSIPTYLEKVRKKSGISIASVKSEIRKQFRWLEKHEPEYYAEYIGKKWMGKPFGVIWNDIVAEESEKE